MSDEVTFRAPPGLRDIKTKRCEICAHFRPDEYEPNSADCAKFPQYVHTSADVVRIHDGVDRTTVCDDWERSPAAEEPASEGGVQ